MGETTGIQWASSTWNPWRGCHKVSSGCANCYMFRDQKRYGKDPNKVIRASPRTFRSPRRWKEPKVIFVCSWSDFFIEEADPWRAEAWEIIRELTRHRYLLLTKRPVNIIPRLPPDWGKGWDHVWLGVTVEDDHAKWRADYLKTVPARHRFISFEPLIGPVFSRSSILHGIDWAITGGESGPNHRHMHPSWAERIRDVCIQKNIPFFHKQNGGVTPKANGRLLDGREWSEVPEELIL